MRKLAAGFLTLMLSSGIAFGEESEVKPPVPPGKGVEKLNTAAGYQMFKTPSRIKVIVSEPSPDQGEIIAQILAQDWTPAQAQKTKLSFPVQREKTEEKRREKPPEVQKKSFYLKGECYIPQKIEVKTLSRPLTVPCIFNGKESGTLHLVLTADLKTGALLAVPKEVEVNGRIMQVVRGIITTQDGSLNVADEVNRQFLKRIAAAGLISGVHSGFEAYKEYAENKNTTTYALEGGTVVQEKKIPPSYPLVSAVLGAFSGMAKAVEGILKSKYQGIPVIFIVKPKTLLFKGEVK